MARMNIVQSLNRALAEEMERDPRVVLLGEDIGKKGGVFNVTKGLHDRFGADRVMNTPLSETGILGAALGMSLGGLMPVAEIQFQDFIFPAFDQLVNEIAKYRYRSGGQYSAPMVIRTPTGGGVGGGHYHSQSGEAYFAHTPGLVTVMPSNPYDAAGMLRTAVRGKDPVVFLEPKILYYEKGDVPEGDFTVPFGEAKVLREGADASVVTWGAMVRVCMKAAEQAEADGTGLEVIDLRSLLPFDIETVLASVRKTGRLMVVHEAPRTSGFGAEIVSQVAERAVERLEAPAVRVAGFDTPFPYKLEHYYMPDADRVLRAAEELVSWE